MFLEKNGENPKFCISYYDDSTDNASPIPRSFLLYTYDFKEFIIESNSIEFKKMGVVKIFAYCLELLFRDYDDGKNADNGVEFNKYMNTWNTYYSIESTVKNITDGEIINCKIDVMTFNDNKFKSFMLNQNVIEMLRICYETSTPLDEIWLNTAKSKWIFKM